MYQFVHVESYSRATPKRASTINKKTGKVSSSKASGHCVSYIVNEAIREVNSIPHIKNPIPPTYVYGAPLEQLEDTCNAWADSVRDARGHATRKDALCLAAGIVSAPKDISPEAWAAFEKDSVEWLKAKYGGALRTVIAHHDESHPHLHFYVVPEHGQRFETVHQGRAAAAQAKAEGGVKGLQNQAYKAAMREYQNEFYDKVGIEHGFNRIGPAKRRLTREEWKLEQIQAAATAQAIAKARDITEVSKASSAEMIESAKIEAKSIAETAIRRADAIEKEAEKRGWQKALDAFEQLPWFKRIKSVVARATDQRDELKNQLQGVKQELAQERAEKQSIVTKAKRWFTAGKAASDRVKELEPALKSAQREARRGSDALRENERLRDDLGKAEDSVKHWRATAEAHMPKQQPVMHVPGKKPKLTQGIEVGLGD
jgi:hypothetical protein